MSFDANQVKATLQRELESLQKTSEELRLRASLARADAKAKRDRLENKLRLVQEQILRMGDHAKEPIHQIEAAARKLLTDARISFEQLRKSMESQLN